MTPSAFSVTLSSEEMQRIKDKEESQAAEIKRLTKIIELIEKSSAIFEANSADICVFYETLYKIANYGSDMQFMREVAADCINGKEKHSLIEKLKKKAEQYRLEKDRSCAEAMEDLIRDIDRERKP